jgi:hypothetical protein
MRTLIPAVASVAFLVFSPTSKCQASSGRPAPRPDASKTQIVELHKDQMSKPATPPPDLSPSGVTSQEKASTPPDAPEPGTLGLVVSAAAIALASRRRSK